jgi:hypothetical protein
VRERPILFSAPMVCAILSGAKTQTRRVYKPRPQDNIDDPLGALWSLPSPYGAPGDRLWVRETWGLHDHGDSGAFSCQSVRGLSEGWARERYAVTYQADWGSNMEECYWRPSIHMPRWASRITLEVSGVRVERLEDISEDDARSEGVESVQAIQRWRNYMRERESHGINETTTTARGSFMSLWESINGTESLVANPWVWVVEFRRVEAQERAA